MKNKKIKVLTLWQPYATLLAYGIKMNETRPKATKHIGEDCIYLIHAAKKFDKFQNDICKTEPFQTELRKIGIYTHLRDLKTQFPLGQIIGAFEVEGCCESIKQEGSFSYYFNKNRNGVDCPHVIDDKEEKFGDYSEGRSIWIGKNHRVLKTPILYKGSQGYYPNFKGDIKDLVFI